MYLHIMSMPFSIRAVQLQEAQQLQQLSITTFTEAFATQNKKEDIVQYLTHAFAINRLAEELNDKESEFYFIENEVNKAGYIKLNRKSTYALAAHQPAVELERIYISGAYQKNGLGQQLLNFSTTWAQQQNARTLCLGVWEHNVRAIRFYERNGFIRFGSHIFMLGTDPQTDLLMARPI